MTSKCFNALAGAIFGLALGLGNSVQASAQGDPLPSWNDTPTKQAIIDFVDRVTKAGGPEFVAAADRIATFDNDGTLWVEHPMDVLMAFALDRVKALAPLHPEWDYMDPFQSVLEGDMKALAESGQRGAVELIMFTHAGVTNDEFSKIVTDCSPPRVIHDSSGTIPNWFTSRCSNCSPICAPMVSRLSSFRAAASSSCARGRRRYTAFPHSR